MPVSLLSCTSKIMDILKNCFKWCFNYLSDNCLLFKDQSGVQQGDATVNQHRHLYYIFCYVLYPKPKLKPVPHINRDMLAFSFS